jgi:hypothetical protein
MAVTDDPRPAPQAEQATKARPSDAGSETSPAFSAPAPAKRTWFEVIARDISGRLLFDLRVLAESPADAISASNVMAHLRDRGVNLKHTSIIAVELPQNEVYFGATS